MDLGVEKTVLDIRRFLKKKIMVGLAAKMMAIVPSIPDKMKRKRRSRRAAMRHVPWNQKRVYLSESYIQTYARLDEMNIWGEGALVIPNDDEEMDDSVMKGPTGETMSASILNVVPIAKDRVRKWVETWEFERLSEPNRPGSVVPTTLLKSKAGGPKHEHGIELLKLTSCNPEHLKALGNKLIKREILQDIEELSAVLSESLDFHLVHDKSKSKSELIDFLCDLREIYFESFPEALADRRDIAEADARYESRSLPEGRARTLADNFHKIHPDASL